MRGRTIAAVGEFGFLEQLFRHLPAAGNTVVGPGHDCAVVQCGDQRFLLTIDALVEGTHFKRHWLSPRQLGHKSFLINASDVAAMGGQPRWCVVAVSAPPAYSVGNLLHLHTGIAQAARASGAGVVGGNLARAAELSITIALLAAAPRRLVTRGGARRGDRIYVTGTVGDAAAGLRLLRGARPRLSVRTRTHLLRRFRAPTPRLQAGALLVESGIASAMIDVSDGLVQDLGHICAASGVGAILRTADVPLSPAYRAARGTDGALALNGGEDYELLCTVPSRNVALLDTHRARLRCPITCIGEITASTDLRVVDARGRAVAVEHGGYDHFGRA